jgi:glucose-6-phosphate 1-dehydrogenase
VNDTESRRKPDPVQADPAPPCVLVIFGGAGDLTRRLLMPALYNLACAGLLNDRFAVIGIDRDNRSDEAYREFETKAIHDLVGDKDSEFGATSIGEGCWSWIAKRLYYLKGDIEDGATYDELKAKLDAIDGQYGIGGSAIFYLATPDRFFGDIVERLGSAGLTQETAEAFRRVIIEKPFGHDLPSAKALNARVLAVLTESQIYRIDHFLGKETVQNIMAFRFANGLFEPMWNRYFIDHVQITAAETVTVEQRGSFYDATGALRDMVPNHMFQLLSMAGMEAPNSFNADAVRSEKAKVIEAVHHFAPDDVTCNVVRGQYTAGTVNGRAVPNYRDEPHVKPDSTTETYVALKIGIDNWRWAGVPFYIRTGKALAARRTEIAIQFKHAPNSLFRDTPVDRLAPNLLIIKVQPDEGVTLRFEAKVPGPIVRLGGVTMDFRYADYFNATPSTGYETLIYDCMIGDATLFQRADNVEAGWAAVQPVLDAWSSKGSGDLQFYAAGSEGPAAADDLLARDGRHWLPLT